MWVRWTLPRFRYDQVMDLGWKVLFEAALAFIILMGGSMLVLDKLGLEFGFTYGLILTAINVVAMVIFFRFIDHDRVISGASAKRAAAAGASRRFTPVIPGEAAPAAAREKAPAQYAGAGVE
jgi:NADH-quinone oxidoreductase subunit H